MAHHPVTSAEIAIHGDHLDSSKVARVKGFAFFIALVGTAASLYLLFLAPEKTRGSFAYSWLFAFYFFLTLSIGGCFWTLLHNVSNSGWGTSVRRTFENLGSTYPWMFLFGIPLLFPQVQQYLYEWMNIHRAGHGNVKEHLHHADHLLYNKYWFMNLPFWYGRVIFWGVGLSLVIIGLRRLSVAQDTDPNPGTARLFKARFHSTYTLIIFALTITFTGFDFVMGLDYKWFSTMWGVYLFAGSALNSMAVIILVAAWLKGQGHLRHVTTGEHFHIMGKLLFAFTVFWAYVTFSQYFLIWNANVPEETFWYNLREVNHDGSSNQWKWIGIFGILFGHFFIPFFFLLSYRYKVTKHIIRRIAYWFLAIILLDMCYNIMPALKDSHGDSLPLVSLNLVWILSSLIGVGGVCVWSYLRSFPTTKLIPIRDPRIGESLTHHE